MTMATTMATTATHPMTSQSNRALSSVFLFFFFMLRGARNCSFSCGHSSNEKENALSLSTVTLLYSKQPLLLLSLNNSGRSGGQRRRKRQPFNSTSQWSLATPRSAPTPRLIFMSFGQSIPHLLNEHALSTTV